MYLPHLKEQEDNRRWEDEKRRELKEVLLEAIDYDGPGYVLEILAEVEEEWSKATFETALLQKNYAVTTIRGAAKMCRAISKARFAMEKEVGRNPNAEVFEALLEKNL